MTRRPRDSGPLTIRDIARLAGVSTATVSRTLMKPAMVAEETREQVLRAVAEAGYTPNLMARSLRRRQSGAILVVVRDIVNPFYPEIFRGVERTARRLGFNVLMGNTDDDPVQERDYLRLVLSRRADGLIALTGRIPDLDDPAVRQLPIVLASEPVPGHDFPIVRIDNRGAAAAMTRHLIGLGHRRIAHIGGGIPTTATPKRFKGYAAALAEAGLELQPDLLRYGTFSIPTGSEHMAALLALPDPPTAVFCGSDEIAIGAIRTIKQAGLRVPEDISIVGFDDIYFAAVYDPPLTTVEQPARLLGFEAMRLLADRLAGIDVPKRGVTVPYRLMIRGSTAPPKA